MEPIPIIKVILFTLECIAIKHDLRTISEKLNEELKKESLKLISVIRTHTC